MNVHTGAKTKENIVGLKELRTNMDRYVSRIGRGESFTVLRRSRPVFRLTPVDDDENGWETIVDFTKIQKGGVPMEDVQRAIKKLL